MSQTIAAVRGMNDILPEQADAWLRLEAVCLDWLAAYGYRNIRMPILEKTELFVRSIGEVTDIVEKEMYTFVDALSQESLSLRPEGTASCVRAVIQHNLLYNGPQRLWYGGPMFRHERPQQGRYRQFHQIGVEALGWAGPDIDAEHIVMTAQLWRRLAIAPLRLEINSLGSMAERRDYRSALVAYFEAHSDALDADSTRRLKSNPLRILDSKNPAMREVIDGAPKLLEHLGADSRAHFDALCGLLEAANVAYQINPRLVRGLDYYNLTVFEWVSDALGSQGTVCAGGRYDSLVEQIGGKPAPACGFAIGLERLLALCRPAEHAPSVDVYLVHSGDETQAFVTAEQLRAQGLRVIYHCGGGSFKSQIKKADASGARYAIIIGDDERAAGMVSLKDLRQTGAQAHVKIDAVAEQIRERSGLSS